MRHYRQLTQEERYQISALKKLGRGPTSIAGELGRSPSTISREINRNAGLKDYDGATAQRLSDKRRREADKFHKRNPMLIEWIEARIRDEWSPEQIAGSLCKHDLPWVSHEWIYRHVLIDKAEGGTLYLHLRQRHKPYRKRYGSQDRRGQIINRIGIEERPKIVGKRSRLGDWEGDTVVGKGKSALVTLVERKSGHLLVRKVERATAELTASAITDALAIWKPSVKTVTFDNGKEFAYHERIAKTLSCKVYFARPYHSWERGTNENTNGLIRQYFPKGTSFDEISEEEIQAVENKLNLRPRKRLKFKAPIEVLYDGTKWPKAS